MWVFFFCMQQISYNFPLLSERDAFLSCEIGVDETAVITCGLLLCGNFSAPLSLIFMYGSTQVRVHSLSLEPQSSAHKNFSFL